MPLPRPAGTVCAFEADGVSATPAAHAAGHWPGFRWTVLQRHGRRPLAVFARALLKANNRCSGLSGWSDIAIYEIANGGFVAHLCHVPPARQEPAWRDTWVCETADAARVKFDTHDPLIAIASASCAEPSTALFLAAWAALLASVFGLRQTPAAMMQPIAQAAAAQPVIAQPVVAQPEPAQPAVTKADVAKADVAKADVAKAGITEPAFSQSAAAQRAVARPAASQRASGRSAAVQRAVSRHVVR